MIELTALLTLIKDPAVMGVIVYVVVTVRNVNKHLDRHCAILDKMWTELEGKADR